VRYFINIGEDFGLAGEKAPTNSQKNQNQANLLIFSKSVSKGTLKLTRPLQAEAFYLQWARFYLQ